MHTSGLEGLTLRSIARASGVSHAAPARHFRGVTGLLSAVAARSFRELTATIDQRVTNAAEEPIQRLVAAGHGYIDFALANPTPYELMFRPERLDRSDEEYLTASLEAFGRLADLVAAAQTTGWKPDVQHPQLSGVVWAGVHGVVSLWIQGALSGATGIEDCEEFGDVLIHEVLGLERGTS